MKRERREGAVMSMRPVAELVRENAVLRRRLEEAEENIRGLQTGEADALLVQTGGERVFTLEPADKLYWLLVTQTHYPAATVTSDGTIISCNHRFADLLLRPLNSVLKKSIHDFVAPDVRPVLEALLDDGLGADARGEVPLQRPDGASVPAYLGVRALREGALGVCLIVTDLTEERHYQEWLRTRSALRASEERLNLAQRAGRIGTFEWNVRTGALSWSATLEELYGLAPGGFGGSFEDWLRAVHPDDRARAEADLRRAVIQGTELDTEFRIVCPDGGARWIASKGKVFYDDGEPLRMLGVSLDETERKRNEEKLLDADRKKDEFVATLAHELRNPLAPMRNAVEILRAKSQHQPEQEWACGVLDRQVRLMARLLEDLLDVSRISRNRLELRTQDVELTAVLETALETSRPVIEARGHQLTLALPPEPIRLECDPVRLAQVFANLLNNAAKYTEERGCIQMTVERGESDVSVSVKDSGIGITAEMLTRVFEIYSQAGPELERSQGGLGIGLSLVKGLVELHGGSVEARSEGPGLGSEFVVRLPVSAESPTGAPTRPPEDEQVTKAKLHILIADDNEDSVSSMAMILRSMGNETSIAHDGEQAVELARSLRPEVLLLDIRMPRLNGYDACRRIRAQPWGKEMFVVALTGAGQDEDHRRTEEAGFDRHIVKPVDPAALDKLLASRVSVKGGQPARR
jgi:PAS domain S-box-containing protein